MVEQPNQEIRKKCKRYGIPLWKLAQVAKISEQTLILWLREDLSEDRYLLLIKIIDELRKEYIT